MSRSGYHDDIDEVWSWVMWRGAVASALRGRPGQAFLREMLAALYVMPEKRLIRHELMDEYDGAVCALGSVGRKREISMERVDPEDNDAVAALFRIPRALACEIMWLNDEAYWSQNWQHKETPEERWLRVRHWVVDHIKDDQLPQTTTVRRPEG